MRYEAKLKNGAIEFVGKRGVESIYVGSLRNNVAADLCLGALYDYHQCHDEFGPDDEIVVEGVGTFAVLEKIHIAPADEETKLAVLGVTKEKPYRVAYDGMDGKASTSFATLDEAAKYVKDRWEGVEYCDSKYGFHNDYGRFTCFGFDLTSIGRFSRTNDVRDFHFQLGCEHKQTLNAICLLCGKKVQ